VQGRKIAWGETPAEARKRGPAWHHRLPQVPKEGGCSGGERTADVLSVHTAKLGETRKVYLLDWEAQRADSKKNQPKG